MSRYLMAVFRYVPVDQLTDSSKIMAMCPKCFGSLMENLKTTYVDAVLQDYKKTSKKKFGLMAKHN